MLGRRRATGSPMRVCLTNLVTPAVMTASSFTTGWPASNITTPERPFMPWYTQTLGAQSVVIDFLTSTSVTGLWLIRTNFAQVTIQGHTADTWTSPAFTTTAAIEVNPWNFRRQLAIPLSGFAYRYLRILIPSQVTTDTASQYVLGGVYAGVAEFLPRDILFDVRFTTVQPRKDIIPESGAWRERLIMGEPFARLSMTRHPRTTRLAPGYGDDVRTWQAIERRIRDSDTFALMLGTDDTSQGFIVRPINEGHQQWARQGQLRMQGDLELEEAMR